MKQYLALLLAVLVGYAPALCLALPPHVFFRRPTGGAPDYTVNTAVFDGTNDYIRSDNQGSTGWADGTVVTMAFWVKVAVINTYYNIYTTASGGSANKIVTAVSSTNTLRFTGYTSGGAAAVDLTSSVTLSAGVWYHVYWCVDSTSAANTKLYVNGVEDTSLADAGVGGTMDLITTGQRMTVAASGAGSPASRLNGSLAELWINDVYLDNVGLFYSAGNPVDLGTNGTTPTGGQPCIYFSGNGSGNSWTAQGTAGTWTITGSLGTDTSP